MEEKKIVLASKSPRRKELLKTICCDFEIITLDVDERLPENIHPSKGVEILSLRKGRAVADLLPEDRLIISSDTLVEMDGIALGKPADSEDAFRMLSLLSGRCHNVHTGVAIHYRGRVYSGVATTTVCFRELGEDEIMGYIATGEPMDKAGAYGIQGAGGKFVSEYRGDYDTVVGLSVRLVSELMEKALKDD